MRPPRSVLLLASVLAACGPAAAADAADAPRPVAPDLVREAIASRWAEIAPPGATLEIRSVPALRHRAGEPTLEVVLPDDPTRPGPRAVPVACRVDGRMVARGLANVIVRAELPVWTVVRPLKRGDVLAPDDVAEDRVRFEREPVRLFRPQPGRRWRVVRDVEVGARLRSIDVRPIPDVEAGAEVRLVSRAGRAVVAVPGRVRRAGNVGDVVLVHNPVTGELVKAVLEDRNTAILVAPGSTARNAEGRQS